MSQGYIKLHRGIRDCWVWQDSEPFTKRDAWIDILLSANHTDKKIMFEGKLRTIHAGQFHTSIMKLSQRWKWDRRKVTNFLRVLEDDEMCTTDSTTHGTTITVVNWAKYQLECTTDSTTNSTTLCTTDVQPMYTNNNDKECKRNINNNKSFVEDPELNDSIKDFIEHRKKLKRPMTDKAVDLFIKKLDKMADTTSDKIAIINNAIERGWQSVYPLKGEERKQETGALIFDIDGFDQTPPFYGLPHEWFENGKPVRERFRDVLQKKNDALYITDDILYTADECYKKYLRRKEAFENVG